uniref:Uncharacterized protein n=1 Tax=Arundo donax TaxID=35708 RepID=A0A0A9NCH6_ARUDO
MKSYWRKDGSLMFSHIMPLLGGTVFLAVLIMHLLPMVR